MEEISISRGFESICEAKKMEVVINQIYYDKDEIRDYLKENKNEF